MPRLTLAVASQWLPLRPRFISSCVRLLSALSLIGLTACSPSTLHHQWLQKQAQDKGYLSETLPIPNGSLHYLEAGQGEPMILIHGFGGDGLVTWHKSMGELSQRYHVFVPDLLGFGQTQAKPPLSLARQVNAVADLIQSKKLPPAILIGTSYGGFVALELARQHPTWFKKVVIVSSPGFTYQDQDLNDLVKRAGANSIQDLFIPSDADKTRRLMQMVSGRQANWLPDALFEDVRQYYYVPRQTQMLSIMAELVKDSPQYRQAYDPKTLPSGAIIWGEKDQIFPLPLGKRFAKATGWPLYIVPNAGHVANNTHVHDFLKVLDQALTTPQIQSSIKPTH